MHWSEPFIGLPWQEKGDTHAGVSCWGLGVLIYREVAGIVLPTYAEAFANSAERAEIAAIIDGATSAWPWNLVLPGQERDLDVAIFRRAGMDTHVGLICGRGRMLHITHDQESAIVDYRSGRWAHRLAGTYRHDDLMGRRFDR